MLQLTLKDANITKTNLLVINFIPINDIFCIKVTCV